MGFVLPESKESIYTKTDYLYMCVRCGDWFIELDGSPQNLDCECGGTYKPFSEIRKSFIQIYETIMDNVFIENENLFLEVYDLNDRLDRILTIIKDVLGQ